MKKAIILGLGLAFLGFGTASNVPAVTPTPAGPPKTAEKLNDEMPADARQTGKIVRVNSSAKQRSPLAIHLGAE